MGKNGKGKALLFEYQNIHSNGKVGAFWLVLTTLKDGLRVKTWQNWVGLGLQAW